MNNFEYFKQLFERKNFESETFDDIEINDFCFSECNLEMTTFYGARFVNCEFMHCNFYGAILVDSNFLRCKLVSVDFSGASLDEAVFDGTMLNKCIFGINAFGRGTSIKDVDFSKSKITDCKFENAKYNHKTIFPPGFDTEELGMACITPCGL